jgi:hypothetical protein
MLHWLKSPIYTTSLTNLDAFTLAVDTGDAKELHTPIDIDTDKMQRYVLASLTITSPQ